MLCAQPIWNYSPDYSLNCTPLGPMTITYYYVHEVNCFHATTTEMWSDISNVSYIEQRIWNQVSHDDRSFERNLSNCEQKPEKVRTSTGFEPVTSRYRCDALTNWAMKPMMLGAGHLWVLMSPWRMDVKWYTKCFIHWTADLKSLTDFFRLLFAIA